MLPSANEMQPAFHEAVQVFASGMAIPHPDKVKDTGAKGVNQKGFGFGGEDAYFYSSGRWGQCWDLGSDMGRSGGYIPCSV